LSFHSSQNSSRIYLFLVIRHSILTFML
jgi:hypothetical protein